ncbi:hypothetical protein BH09ACT1_BH09ACT1_02370 [soil metagenome]
MKRRITAAVVALALGLSGLQALVAPAAPAEAAVGSQFNAGMIISDALFYDGGAMTIETVQNFLAAQERNCAAGATCMKDYRQDTTSKPAVAGRCAAYQGLANESAAQIIARVGAACQISQKVLLVLLEKEQGLVTATSPSASRYRIAAGFGCPDTAACDTNYYGFFNQVYAAAKQFQTYRASAGSFRYKARQNNAILFNPIASCGSSTIYIQNDATAALYNYTPYQPNPQALINLYSTGDGCSSYGNRNFWRTFTDWFGSTSATSLLRTPENPTVYLVVGTNKYPINSFAVYNSYAPLGPASMVSQTYLDTLTTGQPLGRIVRGSDGAVYFVDSAIKLQFTSCAQVIDYGGSCSAGGFIDLNDAQIAALHTGPFVTAVLGTQEGPRYWVSAGVKHEVLDNQSQTDAGLAPGFNVLTEAALADLPYGAPVVRDSVVVAQKATAVLYYLGGAKKYSIAGTDVATLGVAQRAVGALREESLAKIPTASTSFTGAVTSPGSTTPQALTAGSRSSVTVPALAAPLAPTPVSQAFVDSYPAGAPIALGSFVKSPTDDAVYVATSTVLRPIAGWDALVALAGTTNPTIQILSTSVVAAMPKGTAALAPGTMYRTPDNAQIYLADGLGSKIAVRNFDYTTAAGFTKWTYATSSSLDSYTASSANLTYGIQCGTTKYVSVAGNLRAVGSLESLFPFSYVQLDPLTCLQTKVGAAAIDFIRTADGSIYQLSGGQKHHVGSATLTQLNAGKGWMQVPDSFASLIPTGAAV